MAQLEVKISTLAEFEHYFKENLGKRPNQLECAPMYRQLLITHPRLAARIADQANASFEQTMWNNCFYKPYKTLLYKYQVSKNENKKRDINTRKSILKDISMILSQAQKFYKTLLDSHLDLAHIQLDLTTNMWAVDLLAVHRSDSQRSIDRGRDRGGDVNGEQQEEESETHGDDEDDKNIQTQYSQHLRVSKEQRENMYLALKTCHKCLVYLGNLQPPF